jgi:hypothetical protein
MVDGKIILNTFEEYDKRSRIIFQKKIHVPELEEILSIAATEHSYKSTIYRNTQITISNNYGGIKGRIGKERFSDVRGTIDDSSITSTEFKLWVGADDTKILYEMKFSSFGHQLTEIKEPEIQIWDNVRDVVKRYFVIKETNEAYFGKH